MNEIVYSSATELARLIQAKEITSIEVVTAYLERIDAVNPTLNGVVQLAAKTALEQAHESDAALARGEIKGPLHEIPITIKGSLDTAGVITTGGTKGRSSYVPKQDATVVARLRCAGAILLGKTTIPEICLAPETDKYVCLQSNRLAGSSRPRWYDTGRVAHRCSNCGLSLARGRGARGSSAYRNSLRRLAAAIAVVAIWSPRRTKTSELDLRSSPGASANLACIGLQDR